MLCSVLSICFAVSGVPEVLDGDTLRFTSTDVRLAGIDAEELNEPNGYAARRALQSIITTSKHIRCEDTGERTHKRRVMTCRTDKGEDLAEYMVRGGWALDCGAFSRRKYRRYEPEGVRLRLTQKPYC
jgi:endonuclease YncB( thermonuclease family)